MTACTVDSCDAHARCKGLCNKHYHVLKCLRKMKPCACGCGEQTSNTFKWGHHTRLFSSDEQARRGRQNDGSKQRDRGACEGYRKVGGRHEHRTVAERKIGRPLQPGEIVHHADENKRNNTPSNLEVMTQSEHARRHALARRYG